MIRISSKSTKLLLKCLKVHRPDLVWIVASDKEININQKIGNELREAVGDELISNGFKVDGSPNPYGLQLESLIDEIGRLFI